MVPSARQRDTAGMPPAFGFILIAVLLLHPTTVPVGPEPYEGARTCQRGQVSASRATTALHRRRLGRMTDLVINVNWEYFLGIVGSIVALAYYANGRFTRLETSVEWLKQALQDLKNSVERAASSSAIATKASNHMRAAEPPVRHN